jgi:hypothetical protein
MNISKPKVSVPARPPCPVCGKNTYSLGGIHPQCAVAHADKADRAARSAALAAAAEANIDP